MVFVACGLNHKTAPIDLRERFAASSTNTPNTLLHRLTKSPSIQDAAILSTCNRTEIYCETDDPGSITSWLADQFQMLPQKLSEHLYVHQAEAAVRHMLSVACGLDSMMLGEPQILGQLKRCYQDACEQGTINNNLHQIFQYVFSAAKRVRTQSGVGNNPISIAYAAVQLIGQQFKDFSALNVFIIGSGETASLVAKYLYQQGAQQFMIANRTAEHAQCLASRFNGQALSITDIPHYLPQADVIISATACPLPFINKHLIERALADRQNAVMFLLDLAIPRDIEPDVAELDAVRLYNIDDLHQIVGEGMEERRAAATHAEQLIDHEIKHFVKSQRFAKANGVISDYRSQMKLLAAQELERAKQKLSSGECQHNVLSEFSERLVNKLTHLPTLGLRQVAFDERADLLDLVKYLLDKNPEHATL